MNLSFAELPPFDDRVLAKFPPQLKSARAFSADLADGELRAIVSVMRVDDARRLTSLTLSVGKPGELHSFRKPTDEEARAACEALCPGKALKEGAPPPGIDPFTRGYSDV